MSEAAPQWYLYMIETARGALYTGITTNVERRFAEHLAGRGAKALRGRGPLTLVHHEPVGSHGQALRLEAELKRLPAPRKRAWLARRGAEARQAILSGVSCAGE
ncbi:GIY-YIG nuclease family protein [Billgrantia saliphila]|uniref:GIY-YIG nuclease family protein n=1 Tax=Billgrantia saliphila TaxID=1848458 RepID=UPI0022AE9237|nr:GIY-YIG nuclease family protein [Halomonas saliphila]